LKCVKWMPDFSVTSLKRMGLEGAGSADAGRATRKKTKAGKKTHDRSALLRMGFMKGRPELEGL
jgi:hypothetical protein